MNQRKRTAKHIRERLLRLSLFPGLTEHINDYPVTAFRTHSNTLMFAIFVAGIGSVDYQLEGAIERLLKRKEKP